MMRHSLVSLSGRRVRFGSAQEIILNLKEPKHMKIPVIAILGVVAFGVSGCLDTAMMLEENSAQPRAGASGQSPRGALGGWAGDITYTAMNGSSFASHLQARISGSNVTFAVSGSGAESLAARWDGDAVSWASFGSTMVTEWTVVPVNSRTAKVTSRVTQNGSVLANGSGTLFRQ
jgi:hypothetical protein